MAVDSKVSGGFFGWTRRVPREEWDSQNPDLLQEAEAYRGVEGDINYTFRDKGFLVQAFTHRTVPPNRRVVPGYMRPMDFMGDALLKDLLTTQLYGCVYPHGRGAITRARSNIECNRLFAFVVAQHGWQRLFRVGSSTLSDAIAGYVRSVNDRGQSSESAAEAPKPLADLFESLVSAVYMDSNQDIDTVWRSIYPLLRPHVHSEVATIASSGASE